MSDERYRACTACGSLLCGRDEDCPTCDRCGRRGHISCTAGAREQPPPVQSTGRDFLLDAYQEALDLAVYLRGAIYERDGQ